MRSGFVHNRLKIAFVTCSIICCLQTISAQESDSGDKNIEFYFDQTRRYQNQNNIDLALESLDKAAALAENNGNEKGLVDCYHKFAQLYMELDKRETTIFYWDRATVLLNELAYPYAMPYTNTSKLSYSMTAVIIFRPYLCLMRPGNSATTET